MDPPPRFKQLTLIIRNSVSFLSEFSDLNNSVPFKDLLIKQEIPPPCIVSSLTFDIRIKQQMKINSIFLLLGLQHWVVTLWRTNQLQVLVVLHTKSDECKFDDDHQFKKIDGGLFLYGMVYLKILKNAQRIQNTCAKIKDRRPHMHIQSLRKTLNNSFAYLIIFSPTILQSSS